MFRLIEAPPDLATPQPRDQDHCHPALSRASSTCSKMFQGSIYKLQTEIPPLLKNVTACILERERLSTSITSGRIGFSIQPTMSNHSSTFPSYAWHRHELDSQTAPRGGSRYGRDIATLSRGRVMSGDSLKDFHAPDLPPADITPIFSGPHLDLHQLTLRLHILPYPKDWAYEPGLTAEIFPAFRNWPRLCWPLADLIAPIRCNSFAGKRQMKTRSLRRTPWRTASQTA